MKILSIILLCLVPISGFSEEVKTCSQYKKELNQPVDCSKFKGKDLSEQIDIASETCDSVIDQDKVQASALNLYTLEKCQDSADQVKDDPPFFAWLGFSAMTILGFILFL